VSAAHRRRRLIRFHGVRGPQSIDAAPIAAPSSLAHWRPGAPGRSRWRCARHSSRSRTRPAAARACPPRRSRAPGPLGGERDAARRRTGRPSAVNGRGQLFPHSDVDVLILLPAGADPTPSAQIERFLAALWDGRARGRSRGSHRRRLRTRDGRRRDGAHEASSRTGCSPAAGSSTRHSTNASSRRSTAGVPRGEGARAAAAHLKYHDAGLQPRAQRQGEPRGAARSAHGDLDRPCRRSRSHVERARGTRARHRTRGARRRGRRTLRRRLRRTAPPPRRPARGPSDLRPADRPRPELGFADTPAKRASSS